MDAATSVQVRCPVLVGVDGSTQNASAVAWAAAEASSSPESSPLVLVHGTEGPGESPSVGRAVLERAATEVSRLDPRLDTVTEVRHGGVQEALRSAARTWSDREPGQDPAMLVVGRRGHGPGRPVRLGMTARRLVHEPGPPVVLVPEDWSVDTTPADAPVVVDLGSGQDTHRTLGMAMARGLREGRRVVALLIWSVVPVLGQLDRAIQDIWTDHAERAERALETLLAPWREAYPQVELVGVLSDRHPVTALLEQAEGAELLVVPRGDLACAVVEYAECPVAVI